MKVEERKQMKAFDALVRELLSKYGILKKENDDLYSDLIRKEEEIEKLKAELQSSRNDYATLKLAKMISINDNEMKNAKQRITRLVREVNKCIGLLTLEETNEAEA
mgnify:CR=1 FL=1